MVNPYPFNDPGAVQALYNSVEPGDRIHTSQDKTFKWRNLNFGQHESSKPRGLWYACGNDWIKWLSERETPWGFEAAYKLTIDFTPPSWIRPVLRLQSDDDVSLFAQTFGGGQTLTSPAIRYTQIIDWADVATYYNGVEICPYRPHLVDPYLPLWQVQQFIWYHYWDVASGCIWSKDVLLDVERIF